MVTNTVYVFERLKVVVNARDLVIPALGGLVTQHGHLLSAMILIIDPEAANTNGKLNQNNLLRWRS